MEAPGSESIDRVTLDVSAQPGDDGRVDVSAPSIPGVDSGLRAGVDLAGSPTSVLVALTACHSINDLYGLLIPPLLPALRAAFSLTYAQAGAIPFVSTGLSALLQPSLGYVADRRGWRRSLMIAGFVVLAMATIAIGRSSGYATLLLAAAVLGLGASTYHPQSATYLTYYFSKNRGFAQGIHGMGNGIGFMIAPVLVAFLVVGLGWRDATLVLAIPALVAATIVHRALREPRLRGAEGFFSGVTRPLILLTAVNGLALSATSGFITWLPSYYTSLGNGLLLSGALTAAMSVTALAAQPLGGTLSDRVGRRAIVVVSAAGVGLLLASFVLAHSLPAMVAISLAVGFCGSLLPPVIMVYASELAAGHRSGMAVGIVWGLGTAVSSAAPLITGSIIDLSGFGAAFLALAVVSAVGGGLALLLPRST